MDGKLEKSHSSSSMPLISRLDHLDSMQDSVSAVEESGPYFILFRVGELFGRALLHGYEFPPSFPPQTLTVVSYGRDILDTMYSLEGKKYSSARWGCDGSAPVFEVRARSESVPLDFAVKEAQSKGSILDRITSLEERLIQLQIYLESKVQSQSKSTQLEQSETSPSISRRGFSNSFSRFRKLHHNSNQKQPISQVCMDDYSVIQEIEQNPIRKTELEVSSELASQEKKSSRNATNKFQKGSPKHKRMFPTRLFHLRSLLGC